MTWFYEEGPEISEAAKRRLMQRVLDEARERISAKLENVLLLPPDITRLHSGSGALAETIYKLLPDGCRVDVIPTLGQHVPHTPEENRSMFGSIPGECFHNHDWRGGCKRIGEVGADYVKQVSGGRVDWPIPVALNRMLFENHYDLIVNIGQVVPHEVLGFANHNKNYFIGLGGKETICASHMMAACCGIENNLGQLITPLRACYNKAEGELLGDLPHVYVQIVMARNEAEKLVTTGIYIGDSRETYMQAAEASKRRNITVFDKPIPKVVAYMSDEFRGTWVANKAIYRTRMVVADEGELLIVAPALERFGEQPEVDELIRKYHGSSEGRFTITYAPGKLGRDQIEGVGYRYMDFREAVSRYDPAKMHEGWNTLADGEEVFFIHSPAAGLWATREKMETRVSFEI